MTVRPFCGVVSAPIASIYSPTYVCFAADSEVVSKCAVSDPLLSAVDDPNIPFADSCGLETTYVASGESLCQIW